MDFSLNSIQKEVAVVRTKHLEKKQEAIDRMRDQIDKLKHDHSIILESVVAHIRPLIVKACARKQSEVRLWNLTSVELNGELQLGVKPSTHWTGFWDKVLKVHDKSLWDEAGLKLMLDAINERIAPFELEDISDPSMSYNRVYLCTIPNLGE